MWHFFTAKTVRFKIQDMICPLDYICFRGIYIFYLSFAPFTNYICFFIGLYVLFCMKAHISRETLLLRHGSVAKK